METKHTPGPWQHRGLTMISGRKADGVLFTLANVTPAGDLHDAGECAANARLIAAAPDMLAELKYVLAADKYDGALTRGDASLSPAIRGRIERAIAKVEGAQ